MKRANHGTQLKQDPASDKPPVEAPQTGKNPRDAREDDDRLAQNQRELGVESDHKTEEMEKEHRGTFP